MPTSKKIQIIIGYRDRDIERVERCLKSLEQQSNSNFNLAVAQKFSFSSYKYSQTKGWFWIRSHALNTGVKLSGTSEYSEVFLETAHNQSSSEIEKGHHKGAFASINLNSIGKWK